MARQKKEPESTEPAGAPEWMVTFSDCMTLLLTFFVLMLSFSSFDKIERVLALKTVFAKEFSLNPNDNKENDALVAAKLVQNLNSPDQGSEKATLTKGFENHLKKEDLSINFRDRKIFLISSEKVFLGKGSVISPDGRKKLSDMASFLKEVPNRIVISENPQDSENDSLSVGLKRAWAVIDYFTTQHNLDRQRFSISASNTTAHGNTTDNKPNDTKTKRRLEIVLLERSIYN